LLTLTPLVTPLEDFAAQAFSVAIAGGLCGWAVVTTYKNNVVGMSRSSFWLSLVWLWTGLTRLIFAPDPTMFLWFPMILLFIVLSVVHIYMEGVRKGGVHA